MTQDRLTEIRVRGMRVIEDVRLPLTGLTVLIGENGTGKSTLLDALELLRQAGKPGINFLPDVLLPHGGLRDLLRHGADELALEVVVEGNGPRLEYEVAVALSGTFAEIVRERLDVFVDPGAREPFHALMRRGQKSQFFDVREGKLQAEGSLGPQLAVGAFGLAAQPAFLRLTEALRRIEHQVSFETRPLWQEHELGIRQGPRWPSLVEGADSLARYAANLPNCFHQLRNLGNGVWKRVIQRAQLGLGHDLRDFRLTPMGRGEIELEVVFGSAPDRPVAARNLSEGQLAYLAFIAISELPTPRSVLVFDEPENHLNPALLARVTGMLEEISQSCPVVVATHSDRLLDALAQPDQNVVLCELDEKRAMKLRRPNRQRLEEWLVQYQGLGSVRAEGYQDLVFEDPIDADGAGDSP